MNNPSKHVSKRVVLRAGVAGLATSLLPVAISRAAPQAAAPLLSRGISIHHLLNWPQVSGSSDAPVYKWPPFGDPAHQMTLSEMRRLKTSGFDFVRLTVDPAPFLAMQDARFDQLVAIVMDRVNQLQNVGFSVILDLHPVAQDARYKPAALVDAAHPELFDLYVKTASRIAAAFKDMPNDRFVLELFNEPPFYKPDDVARWQIMMERLHAAARAEAPNMPLVLTGASWGDIHALPKLNIMPFRGSNVFYTFHYYLPAPFTHQGVENVYTQYIRGLRWPPAEGSLPEVTARSTAALNADRRWNDAQRAKGSAELIKTLNAYYAADWGPKQMEADLGGVARWASANGIAADRVLMGEFGAVRRPDLSPEQLSDRHAWLETLRRVAEKEGFPWAFWAYRGYGGMAMAEDKAPNTIYQPDLAALGLTN